MKQIAVIVLITAALFSCTKKDKDPTIIVPPSGGSTMQLNGGEGGTDAENSVYVDFSADKQTSVLRKSWDLGFFCGTDFGVIINNTTFAFAKVTDKTDINTVGTADAEDALLSFNHATPPLLTSRVADDVNGDLSKTAIPTISATDVENKVVIINRGSSNAGIGARPYVKVRILRNGAGYTLQYAPLESTTFKTVQIVKNNEHHFVHINLDNGAIVTDFPKKTNWDVQWGYSVQAFKTFFYGFSDVVAINNLSGVQAFEAVYADATTASNAFNKFNKDSVAKYNFSTNKWVIGGKWRVASPGVTSVFKDRFYVVKDVAGNVYKLKFISFSEKDGGTRGKPQIRYDLIK